MNNKNFQLCSALVLALGFSSAYASLDLPLGSGTIDGTSNKTAKVALAPIAGQGVIYNITCDLIDPTGSKLPAIVQYQILGGELGWVSPMYTFDTIVNSTNQALLNDNSVHKFAANGVNGNQVNGTTTATLTWLAGDDVATPINYSCSARPSVGLKK